MTDVYLFRGKHPLYETLVSHPPEGVLYHPRQEARGLEEYVLYNPSHSLFRRLSDGVYDALGTPRYYPVLRQYDLVHSSRGFLILGPNRYVVDIEHIASFVGMKHTRLMSERPRQLIRKAMRSDKLRMVLPHCEAARRSMTSVVSEEEIRDKVKVVYPVVDVDLCTAPRVSEEPPRILFIGEYFWKGGREVIEACALLRKKLDFKLTYISIRVPPPPAAVEKAKGEITMEYYEKPIPRKELFEKVYPRSDIFVMPTYLDTFGYTFLEAMAFGMPCIGARHFAVPEIVEDGINGLLVTPALTYFDERGLGHPEYVVEEADGRQTVKELCSALTQLIESRPFRERMGSEGKRMVTSGKFSVVKRNESLRLAYEESLRR